MSAPAPIIVGQSFGRWKVIREGKPGRNDKYVVCKCACGTEKEVRFSTLRKGESTSCGCTAREERQRKRELAKKLKLTKAGLNRRLRDGIPLDRPNRLAVPAPPTPITFRHVPASDPPRALPGPGASAKNPGPTKPKSVHRSSIFEF